MPSYVFSVVDLKDGKEVRKMTVAAMNEQDAVRQLWREARTKDREALIGATGRVVYPHGVAGGETWVLLRELGRDH